MDITEKVKILVVDDLKEKILVYRTILEELDEDLVTAQSGEEALKQVLRCDFAVILLDVNMPGMDGFETATLIRKRIKSMHTPIIFITAFLDEMRSQEGYALGAVDYILAPVDPDILRAKVKVFIDLFRMQREVERRAGEKILLAQEHARRIAAEDSSQASSFLARASAVLSKSLELPEILTRLAHLNVPYLADICIVSIVKSHGEDGFLDACAATAELSNETHDAIQQSLKLHVHQVLETGQHMVLDNTDDSLSGSPVAKLWQALEGTAIQTIHLEPLLARGKILGVIVCFTSPQRHARIQNYLQLLEDLAARAAIAIDNVLLLESIREADQRKDEFLAMLAHELRNPLAPISNALFILKSSNIHNKNIVNATHLIGRQLNHLTRLVDDLLDVSRITRGKIRLQFETIDITTVIANAIEASRPNIDARCLKLHAMLPSKPVHVKADPVRLTQVCLNLLNNSAKYTHEAGSIWLSVEQLNDKVELRIKDNGVGIPVEMQKSIFELFTQVNHSLEKSQGGLGIGLTLVKRLVEMHQGTIEVHSLGQGHGSEFIVRLPVCDLRDKVPVVPAITGECRRLRKKILVVDDNVDAASSMAMLLEIMNNEVIIANNGPDALVQAERFRPDVVFLDIGMPQMNGYEVARILRQNNWGSQILIAALTGWGQDQDRQLSKEAGIDEHLVKPIDAVTLERLLESCQTKHNARSIA